MLAKLDPPKTKYGFTRIELVIVLSLSLSLLLRCAGCDKQIDKRTQFVIAAPTVFVKTCD